MSMHNPPHPGEILRELVIEPLGLSIIETANHLGISRMQLAGLGCKTPMISGKLADIRITPVETYVT